MDVLNQLRDALGRNPSSFVERGYPAELSDLSRLVGRRETAGSSREPALEKTGIWPLISHHTFNRYNPFGLTRDGNLHKRALMSLLAHHGIVASDPLVEIERLWQAHKQEESLRKFNTVIRQFAQIEPLAVEGLMRFESYRPTFASEVRRSVLNAFNVDNQFSDFTYLIEAYDAAKQSGRQFEIAYAQDVYELYDKIGLESPDLSNATEAYQAMLVLGEALIQVSWQFAVCSYNSTCDITVSGDLEKRLLSSLISQWKFSPNSERIDKQLYGTRHFERLSLGDLPNVNSIQLSVKDAVKLRKHHVFDEFRGTLTDALDDYERQLEMAGKGAASGAFEDVMRTASHSLQNQLRQSPVKAFAGGAFPVAITAVSTYLPVSFVEPALVPIAAGAAAVVTSWAIGQSKAKGHKVAVRYCAELGGSAQER